MDRTLRDSRLARWGALFIVSFTMMAAYYVNDIMAPLKGLLESQLGWTSGEYGFFAGAYSFLNVFFLMLIWGGLILDRFGIRLTGILATVLMVGGSVMEYIAINYPSGESLKLFGTLYNQDVVVASAGYSIFGVGAEVAGITVTKIIAKWFKGKELATAMGVQVALARIGSQVAYSVALPIANSANFSISTPLFIGVVILVGGMIAFLAFSLMDRKLDKQTKAEVKEESEDDEKFSFADVKSVISNPGFWLIAVLCVLFYSCVFPFQKFATELMTSKYGIDADLAGTVAGLPALGALLLTPLFGGLIDKKGKAASFMMLGSAMLILVHSTYALPMIDSWVVAIVLMIILGIAFSLVPSAMWPSVAKIFPVKQLGTAYALIFFIQNIGLWGIPTLIGKVLESCVTEVQSSEGVTLVYDYTLPMCIFAGIATLSFFIALWLKMVDARKGYGLEKANMQK